MEAVASSMRITRGDFKRARARHINCLWPWERLPPPSATSVSRLRKTFWFMEESGWEVSVSSVAFIKWTRRRAS